MRQTTGFARLPDGERIALAVVGSGPAVVLPAWWVSNVVEDWHFDPLRRFVEGVFPVGEDGGPSCLGRTA